MITAALLGFILGDVCRDQGIVGGELLLRRKQADPNAHLDRPTRSLAQQRANIRGHLQSLLPSRLRQHDRELVTTQAGEEVRIACPTYQHLGDGLQRPVARLMPLAVVDELEVVDIEHKHGASVPIARGIPQTGIKLGDQTATVIQTGQPIVSG